MAPQPRVTVLIPVYNGEKFLAEAIESILGQTFTDFELLIIDDGSTDSTPRVISAFNDPRIRFERNQQNLGLSETLNRGKVMARGEYLARMDSDDVSLPQRLSRQVAFMDNNPDVGICGTWLEAFSDTSRTVWPSPGTHDDIVCSLLFESVMYHPTVIFRNSHIDKFTVRYSPEFPAAQDYELWSRCSGGLRLANVPEVLLRYRLHDEKSGRSKQQLQIEYANRVRSRLLRELGIEHTEEELALHASLALWQTLPDLDYLRRAHDWLKRLEEANRHRKIYPEHPFCQVLAKRWYIACIQATSIGLDSYRSYFGSPLSAYHSIPMHHRIIFMIRSLLGVK